MDKWIAVLLLTSWSVCCNRISCVSSVTPPSVCVSHTMILLMPGAAASKCGGQGWYFSLHYCPVVHSSVAHARDLIPLPVCAFRI